MTLRSVAVSMAVFFPSSIGINLAVNGYFWCGVAAVSLTSCLAYLDGKHGWDGDTEKRA